MRKLLAAAVALVSALAFFVVGSPAANAFGSEVLGCYVENPPWLANSCDSAGNEPAYGLTPIYFSPHNTSGTYTTSWCGPATLATPSSWPGSLTTTGSAQPIGLVIEGRPEPMPSGAGRPAGYPERLRGVPLDSPS